MHKTLIIGNLGYIGPVLTKYLRDHHDNQYLIGYDTGFFENCTLDHRAARAYQIDQQIYGDVRSFDEKYLSGIDHVIYLAAISNDPMGNVFAQQTSDINHRSAVKIALAARRNGVQNFVFASSCSTYGFGGDQAKTEQDEINPLTAYARSKMFAERDLAPIATDNFKISCLRFGTACGASPRLRLDLVLNDFVASAISQGQITILSDGSPLRPLIDVKDMAAALHWATNREGDAFLTINVGCNDWNFSVREIAQKVCDLFDNVSLSINQDAEPDKRSYKVDFSLFQKLSGDVYPQRSLDDTIAEIADHIKSTHYDLRDFRKGPLMRLNMLKELIDDGRVNTDLYWL